MTHSDPAKRAPMAPKPLAYEAQRCLVEITVWRSTSRMDCFGGRGGGGGVGAVAPAVVVVPAAVPVGAAGAGGADTTAGGTAAGGRGPAAPG